MTSASSDASEKGMNRDEDEEKSDLNIQGYP